MTLQMSLPFSANDLTDLSIDGLSPAEQTHVIELALEILGRRHTAGQVLGSPADLRAYLRIRLGERYNEVFGAIFLDNHHRIVEDQELFQGSIAGCSVHPRVVVQKALSINAAALIIYHCHPSGVAEPSDADQQITRRLVGALALVDIRVLDHLVVGSADSVSFAERGLI